MARRLPPLNPLRTFEAAARHVSFTRAAEELGVTATAVSRQVSVLEAYLDRALFARHNSELSLTEAGGAYLIEVQPALELIASATSQVRRRAGTRLVVRCEQSLALHWLNPRLAKFSQLRPKLQIELLSQPASEPADLGVDEVRVGQSIRGCTDLAELILFNDHVAPVCAPALMRGQAPPRTPADLLSQPLLACFDQRLAWSDWLRAMGVVGRPTPNFHMDDPTLLYDAARRGLGFAIAPLELLGDLLREGSLVAPFRALARGGDCRLVYRHSPTATPAQDFAFWLAKEMQAAQPVTPIPIDRAA